MYKIALAGNPNSGKTTLFNALTGSSQFVGNWPGVTVEKKGGKMKIGNETIEVMDLPGIYSLSPYSNEEIISRDYILKEKPDVVIDIVDASNLERNLYLTTQLMELGVPVVVALNMIDVVKKKGEVLDSKALASELGCPVCEISAINNTGLDALKKTLMGVLKNGMKAPEHSFHYEEDVEGAIAKLVAKMNETGAYVPMNKEFAALKALCNDTSVVAQDAMPTGVWSEAEVLRAELEKKYDDDIDSVVAEQRYGWIKSVIGKIILKKREETLSLSDKIDRVLTNKWLALPIFFLIIYGIYFVCLNPNGLGKKLVGITFTWVINAMIWTSTTLTNLGVTPWLVSLVSDGLIFGVGIVLAFIPYLAILFVFLAILEECGYMARVSFIMDRIFRRFGLSGKSFVPMLLGTGCTVQAVAASRTIENENDRKMTIFLTPFIPCATMMPTIIMVVGIFTESAWVAPLVYLMSIVFVIIGGIFLKHTFLKGEPAPFVMELPEYKLPRIKNVVHFVWEKSVALFRKAGTIITVTTVIVWALKYFNAAWEPVTNLEESMLANVGMFFAPLFKPLGFGDWKLLASLLTGYVAKDNFLGTMAQIYGTDITSAALGGILSPASAISFLMFFILSSPCFSSMGAMRKELGTAKLTGKAIGFQMVSAYIVALICFQIFRFVF